MDIVIAILVTDMAVKGTGIPIEAVNVAGRTQRLDLAMGLGRLACMLEVGW